MITFDLMIDDWVIDPEKNTFIQVKHIDENMNVTPIRITKEILEYNDFVKDADSWTGYPHYKLVKNDWIVRVIPNPYCDNPSVSNDNTELFISSLDQDALFNIEECKYIHELQHAFKLLGIPFKISLKNELL